MIVIEDGSKINGITILDADFYVHELFTVPVLYDPSYENSKDPIVNDYFSHNEHLRVCKPVFFKTSSTGHFNWDKDKYCLIEWWSLDSYEEAIQTIEDINKTVNIWISEYENSLRELDLVIDDDILICNNMIVHPPQKDFLKEITGLFMTGGCNA